MSRATQRTVRTVQRQGARGRNRRITHLLEQQGATKGESSLLTSRITRWAFEAKWYTYMTYEPRNGL